jgi:hypothetical protein
MSSIVIPELSGVTTIPNTSAPITAPRQCFRHDAAFTTPSRVNA